MEEWRLLAAFRDSLDTYVTLSSSKLLFIVCLPTLTSCAPHFKLVAGTGLMCESRLDIPLGKCLVAHVHPYFPTYRHQ
jgi:hypothetical protein